jgi:DNA-binding transcriptional ArsR family regulator
MREFLAVTKALSSDARVRVLMMLRNGELCLCQIIDVLGLAPSTVSKHLAVLSQAGLVEWRREGRWRYYRLAGAAAPPEAAAGLGWCLENLADDPQIMADADQLGTVLEKDLEELCACYRA